MPEEEVWVVLDAAAAARKYRALEREYQQRADAFADALEGMRVRLNRRGGQTIMEKSVEAGYLQGQAGIYGRVAEQFEHLVEARQAGRIAGPEEFAQRRAFSDRVEDVARRAAEL